MIGADEARLELEADLLVARVRAGELCQAQLDLAEWLGDPAARLALGHEDDPAETEPREWLQRFADWPGPIAVRAGLAVVRAFCATLPRPDALRYAAADRAIEAWLACPCAAHAWSVPWSVNEPGLDRGDLLLLAARDAAPLVRVGHEAAELLGDEAVGRAVGEALLPLARLPAAEWRRSLEDRTPACAAPGPPSPAALALQSRGLPPEHLWLAAFLGHEPAQESLRAGGWWCSFLHGSDRYMGRCHGCWIAVGEVEPGEVRDWIRLLRRHHWGPPWTGLADAAVLPLCGPEARTLSVLAELSPDSRAWGAVYLLEADAEMAAARCGDAVVRAAIRDALLPELLR